MTGARIEMTLKAQAAVEAIDRLIAIRFHVMEPIGLALRQVTQARFFSESGPDGTPWKALNPAYAAIKKGPGILRGPVSDLWGSITFRASASEVTIGSIKKYAAVQQFGATITAKNAKALRFQMAGGMMFRRSVTIPARPYLGFGDADQEAVLEVVDAAVQSALE